MYTGDEKYPTFTSVDKDLKEAEKLHGPTGGFQPVQGAWYLPFGKVISYKPGSFSDHVVEAFVGTHDLLGGQMWGWYGDDGNTSTNHSKLQSFAAGVATGVAIPVAAPFALSDLMSPDMMQLLLELGK